MHKINPSDFKGLNSIALQWCWLSDNRQMVLMFYYDLSKDNVWYEIEIGETDKSGDNYHVIDSQKFNSINKACKYWNGVIEKDE